MTQLKSNTKSQLRYGIGLAGIGLAMVLAIMMVAMGASAADVSTHNVSLDDPDNETIEVTLDFAASTEATVELTDGTTIYDSTTVTGNSTISPVTATLSTGAADAGMNLSINVDSPDATNVSINETRLIKSTELTVSDVQNETVVVDAVFDSTVNGTADVTITDSVDAEVLNDTLSYTVGNDTTVTAEYNASDGLVEDTLTVDVAFSPIDAYDSAFAQIPDGDSTSSAGGLIGGEIAGQDTSTVVIVLAVVAMIGYYGREEGWI